jgi:ABC-2 type transport system ATP-binding protein
MVELKNLTKRYGSCLAVDNLSLEIPAGQVFGFLGPNGAGKTTTIRMMMGLLQPSSGSVRLNGHDLADDAIEAKRRCGFVPDRPHIYEKLTAAEFLDFAAGLHGVEPAVAATRRNQLLHTFDLEPWADELLESFSHGMKQRTVMAAALIHTPRLLVVDEPMVGMDPRGARLLKRTFRKLGVDGVTVFMSTHSLEVAEETCDRIGILHQGRLIAEGTTDELRRLAGSHVDSKLEAVFLKLTGGDELAEGLALQA